MKRSEINKAIKDMENLLKNQKFNLPDFCNWTAEEWNEKGSEYDEIRENMLGWDVTDYGMGNFEELGLVLVTIRNGNLKNKKYAKPYAEKVLMVYEGQISPMHFHWNKMEDIINRGGGNIVFRLFNAGKDGEKLDTDVKVTQDGRSYFVPAGSEVVLKPGQSITLKPYDYHEFYIQPGTGDVLIGEVSMVNDDNNDNRFFEPLGRFPEIEEDEPVYRYLCNEYPEAE
jgi:D-lyxose ketol-isomerase